MTDQQYIDNAKLICQAEAATPTLTMGNQFAANTLLLDNNTTPLPQELIDALNGWHATLGDVDWIDIMKWVWRQIKTAARWLWDLLFD